MFAWLKKNWIETAAAVGVGVVGTLVWQKHAAAMSASKNPPQVTVPLSPGSVSIAVAPQGSVILTLPQGASWRSDKPLSPLNPTAVQPTGNISFNVQMSATAGSFPLTAAWTDSSGKPQTTSISITVA